MQRVIVLGTGGTIAGAAASAEDAVGYRAAERPVAELVHGFETEQVAQVDSKDMTAAVLARLAHRVAHHLAREEVRGVVITHGTDTMEETAWLLQRVLQPAKPVVLTGAMRPATSQQADGPQNLADALTVAGTAGAGGVVVVFAGSVFAARDVRKVHPYRLAAFTGGDAGPLAHVEQGAVRLLRAWPAQVEGDRPLGVAALPAVDEALSWPWVEIVVSGAAAGPRAVEALVAAGVRGLVVAATGNGTVHEALELALREAQYAGVAVLRATRCADGSIVDPPGQHLLPSGGALTPVQARIELMLRLLAATPGG